MAAPDSIQADQHAEPQEKIKSDTENLITSFSEECERLKIKNAAAIVLDPESNTPRIYLHGHLYDTAVMLSQVLRHVKQELNGPLA